MSTGIDIFNVLFARPGINGKLLLPESCLFQYLAGFLSSINLTSQNSNNARCCDYLNALEKEIGVSSFKSALYSEIFESFVAHRVLPHDLVDYHNNPTALFLLKKTIQLLNILANSIETLAKEEQDCLLPNAKELFATLPKENNPESISLLVEELLLHDRFAGGKVFRYIGKKFIPTKPDSAKGLERFYGFHSVRAIIRDHFEDFAIGKTNLPLLIYSLPGYGKTSLTVSHAIADNKAVLILPEPEALEEDWLELVAPLIARPDHKFVIFFDDIDPRSIDWYNFRTHVGGAFSLPNNIMPVLSSNYEFPASILSRGRRVSFPVFDELRCSEMIEDFLVSYGLKSAPRNLVSLIGADYCEEFGQKKFTELSPRTLMRYLAYYEGNQSKRRTMVELSMGELITKPDAELFYEFNINLMRTLYGDEYIDKLREAELRKASILAH
jgi:predicted AAA+ superfamily ATPase